MNPVHGDGGAALGFGNQFANGDTPNGRNSHELQRLRLAERMGLERDERLRYQQVTDLPEVISPSDPLTSPNWSLEPSLEDQLRIDPGTP
jgi:hypothetical protein